MLTLLTLSRDICFLEHSYPSHLRIRPAFIRERLALKIGKIISSVGTKGLKQLGKNRKLLREQIYGSLRTGRIYVLDPNKKFVPAN